MLRGRIGVRGQTEVCRVVRVVAGRLRGPGVAVVEFRHGGYR